MCDVRTARFLIYGILNDVGFFITWFLPRFLFRPGSIVKLYFSVPVVLYTVFSVQKTLAKNPGQQPGQKSGQKCGKKNPGTLTMY